MTEFTASSPEETVSIGERLGRRLFPGAVVALSGPLGAGKTTFTKGIGRALGIEEEITSPTFTIISEYEGRLILYHMDLYRIGSTEEFENLGVDDMLYGEGVCVLEWSENATGALPDRRIEVRMQIGPGGERTIGLEGIEL